MLRRHACRSMNTKMTLSLPWLSFTGQQWCVILYLSKESSIHFSTVRNGPKAILGTSSSVDILSQPWHTLPCIILAAQLSGRPETIYRMTVVY